jgi:3-deoxy-manno-octulosonate cytidylyltransferase (CMP-KDO synthetase)
MKPAAPCVGIIPARYQSTRFPGKPLADILGKPMFWHVYQRAKSCPQLDQVVLATDDQRIYETARSLDVAVIITRSDHPSGTDRILEAAKKLQVPDSAVVVNVQGDEPLLDPAMITTLVAPFADAAIGVTTLAHPISPEAAQNPNRVTVVVSKSGRGLYFSRTTLPYDAGGEDHPIYGHIGLYAYRMRHLKRFVALGPTLLEKVERLEMLRLLENDIPIHVQITDAATLGVDHPDDLTRVVEIMRATTDRI